MRLQRRQMRRRRIPLVRSQSILGPDGIQRAHGLVAGRLGKDGSSGYRGLGRITLDDGARRVAQAGAAIAVDQHLDRRQRQPVYGALHREHGCVEDVEPIDFLDIGLRDSPRQRPLPDQRCEALACCLAELLGIIQAGNRPRGVEDHRRGHHRPAQRPATGLVHPAHQTARGQAGRYLVEKVPRPHVRTYAPGRER